MADVVLILTSCSYYSAPTDGTFSGDFDDLANSNDCFIFII